MIKHIACMASFLSCICACLALRALPAVAARSEDPYRIEAVHRDEVVIINGEVFRAQSYCHGWEEGDEVIFVKGKPNGLCASAELYNLDRRSRCAFWCE